LTFNPRYSDERIAVYATRPEYDRDFDFEFDLHAPIGIVRAGDVPTAVRQADIVSLELRWGSRAAPQRDLEARIALIDEAGEARQQVDIQPCSGWPAGDWPSGAIAIGRYSFRVDPHLPPGQYGLSVALVGEGQQATLAHLTVDPLPRSFEAPTDLAQGLDVRFGDEFKLLGYDLAREGSSLNLTLYWQATRRPQESYKVFVHLFDPTSEALAGQVDTVPRSWTYPTTWWEAGETVSDVMSLSLADVPSGQYRIAVGMYSPGSGERVPVFDSAGERQPQRRLTLPEEIDL
jgi:hypothetical protein